MNSLIAEKKQKRKRKKNILKKPKQKELKYIRK